MAQDDRETCSRGEDCIVVKALENGVTIIGMSRGRDTRLLHTEKLDEGEVMIAQFTESTSAMKIRGRAEILTRHGTVASGRTSGRTSGCTPGCPDAPARNV